MICSLIFAAATLTVGETEFPTYDFFDPDPCPLGWSRRYPYFSFTGYVDKAVPKKWRTVVLENDRTRVTMLPQIGGKVWGAEDKATGHEYIYFNHVVKFRNIAMRGPWTSGGIEFNTGITGHYPNTSTPTDWTTRKNDDGSVSYFCGGIENVCRTWWQVEVRLGRDDDFFTTRMTRYNMSNLPVGNYQWMNAAYSAEHNAQFFYPGANYIGHPGDAHAWTVDDGGRDISYVSQNAFGGAKSYHVLNGDNGLFSVWYHDWGFGAYHQTERFDKFGRKIWLWALSRNGQIWTDLLTDRDGNYTELQSGRTFQQPESSEESTFGYTTFDAGASEEYVEKWGAVRSRADLDRLTTDLKSEIRRPLARPSDYKTDTAAALTRTANQYILDHKWDKGEALLDRALAKEPCFVPALEIYAFQMLERGRYGKAREYARKAMAVDTYSAGANFADGFAAFADGRNDLAIERFGIASLAIQYRAPAYAFIARIRLREGRFAEAVKIADRALDADANCLDALVAKATALRHLGDAKAAKAVLAKAMVKHPLYQFFRFESFKLGGEDFVAGVQTELPDQTMLDLALWYEESGLADEAFELYGFAPASPMAAILKANLQQKLGHTAEALATLKSVAGISVTRITPFRREERAALEWANKVGGDFTWKIPYLLSVYLEGRRETTRARELLNGIAAADEAVFYLHRLSREPNAKQRWADIAAVKKFPDQWRVGTAIASAYAAEQKWGEACDVLADYTKRFPRQNCLELYYAQLLYKAGRYDTLFSFFLDDKNIRIKPSEYGGSAGWWIELACADLCRKALAAGDEAAAEKWFRKGSNLPENVGSGKPYAEDLYVGHWPEKFGIPYLADEYNKRFGKGDRVKFAPSADGKRLRVAVTGPCGKVEFDLVGAKDPTWTVAGAKKSEPIDFGELPTNALGLVTGAKLMVCRSVVSPDRTAIALETEWSPGSTLSKWPNRYHFLLEVIVGRHIGEIRFTTKNVGEEPFEVPAEFRPPKAGTVLKPGETCTRSIRL